MENKTNEQKRRYGQYVMNSLESKRKIVMEIEQGIISINEAMEQYGIRSRETIRVWIAQFGTVIKETPFKKKMDKIQKRKIVHDILSNNLSIKEASRKYEVNTNTLNLWRKQFSEEIATSKTSITMEVGDKNKLEQTDAITKELQLKIVALETMIDIAEKELGIEIRKKSGTKQ